MSAKSEAAAESVALYSYHKIYPRQVKGGFRRLKWAAMALLMGIYYAAPFLRWDRGPGAPGQAILIDMPGRRAYFFFIEIWPQEVYYLTGILIMAAVGLFLATSLLGRVWCGFACWQTQWTDLFLLVEGWFEGERSARIRLDQAPWSAGKLARKVGKHLVWIVVAALTGGAFVLYFDDAPALVVALVTGQASVTEYSSFAVLTGLTYLLAGWAREQVCIYMCPWPRFQGAMFDDESLIVTYEAWRGEPRGAFTPDKRTSERGHCVDCKMCVQVCPTGIDIRDGSQLACVGCALCVDACNAVMDRFGLPRGLITYDSNTNMVARSRGLPTRKRLIRPRTVAYAAVLALVGCVMLWSLTSRATTELTVLHERSPLYVSLGNGSVRNGYTVKILNMVRQSRTLVLQVAGLPGATLTVVGVTPEPDGTIMLPVAPDSVGTYQAFVTAPRGAAPRQDITFSLGERGGGRAATHPSIFAGPATTGPTP